MRSSARSPARRASLTTVAGLAAVLLAASCQHEPECPPAVTSTQLLDKLTTIPDPKIDILLDIDNSRSMADKQQILALAVPDLIKGLVNPGCFDPKTGAIASIPAGPMEPCPAGTERKVTPILDIHIGIISSSLGGHGSDACLPSGSGKHSVNDKAHLLARTDPTMLVETDTYQDLDFLAWDPAQKLSPPGEADIDKDTESDPDNTALVPQLTDMVLGVGQIGCGYEAQLEAWYRFLVDPSPAESISLDAGGNVVLEGVDQVLLDQRRAFLRPDSMLAVVLLSDENDCSIREEGQLYLVAQQKSDNGAPFHLPKAREVCDQSPGDPCCFSCGQKGPTDDGGNPICPEDPTCFTSSGATVKQDDLEDNINLRCWNQKRRFGIDFLYGIDRYVDALRSHTITNRAGEVVPNPIFTDLDPTDAVSHVRSSGSVFFAGIVGVPWQDIARTSAAGVPDLATGLDPYGQPIGGFKSADELLAPLPGKDYNTWDVILGDPAGYPAVTALPKDPLMIESVEPRAGKNPITLDPIVTASQPLGNKINGHETSIPKRDDLQYACIFPLIEPRDCAYPQYGGCDCEDPNGDSPLCAVNPDTGKPTTQVRAKAYPGIRVLQVLQGIGSQGIVASVCAVQLTAPEAPDFGYRAAIGAILERLAVTSEGGCLTPHLRPDEAGRVSCVVLEAMRVEAPDAAACNLCAGAGRDPVSTEHEAMISALQAQSSDLDANCFCEIHQLAGAGEGQPLWACQNDLSDAPALANGEPVDGFCYIDAETPFGDPELVDHCPSTERRTLRFVGAGNGRPGSTLFIACAEQIEHDPSAQCAAQE